MADDLVVICNMALGHIGISKRVTAIDEAAAASSPQAAACSTYLIEALKQISTDYRWTFLTKRSKRTPYTGDGWDSTHAYAVGDYAAYGGLIYRALAATTNNQPNESPTQWLQITRDEWPFASTLPDDFLEPHSVTPMRSARSDEQARYTIENANDGSDTRHLLTDTDEPLLVYTAYVENPRAYTSKFTLALSYLLAAFICGPLQASVAKQEEMLKLYRAFLSEAIALDAKQRREDPEPISEFEAARNA